MPSVFSRAIAALLICAFLVSAPAHAKARPEAVLTQLGPGSKTTLIVAALVAVVAAIGVGVYFSIHQAHTVKGCVSSNGNALELTTGDGKNFALLGATSRVQAGDRIKVTGSRKKRVSGVNDKPSFIVDKLDKDYGSCPRAPVHP